MEIGETTLPGFYVSRALGLAPYLIKRNDKNYIDDIRRSTLLCCYSICFMIATVSMTVRFIFVDAAAKSPIRMIQATAKFVAVLDVCIVVGACLFGGITGLFGNKFIRKINSNLRKADDELAQFNEQLKEKKRNLIMVVIVFIAITLMIILDAILKYRSAKKYRAKMQQEGNPTGDIYLESYFPFYVQYYILMALHTQFAQTAFGVQRRYVRLNLAIKSIFSLSNLPSYQRSQSEKVIETANAIKVKKVDIRSVLEQNTADQISENSLPGANVDTSAKPFVNVTTISRAAQEDNHVPPVFGTGKTSALLPTAPPGKLPMNTLTRASFFLDRLSYTHAILGRTVILVSKCFGMTLLAMLASCLLHLVATSYFLFSELLGDPDILVASLQLLWCCFHLARLLLIVEPCHMATNEARKTIIIVCEALRNCRDTSVEPILQRFWRQLLADRTYYFTACGMCTIDRQIITSISGAIATYLVRNGFDIFTVRRLLRLGFLFAFRSF